MDLDRQFMEIALDCAALGRGGVEPNPMVGAVLVKDGVELARGYHRKFGGPHAEIEALAASAAAGRDVRGATLYVTLEPCCHRNKKTPPCTDAILPSGVSRVVVAMADPDANVSGRGIEILRGAGIDVRVGVEEEQARKLLCAYIKLRLQRRPWVICKWAQTADGRLALPPGAGRWITNELSRQEVHRLRSYCDAILVGAGTVAADDPLLNNRSGQGRQPVRVVLDGRLRTPPQCQLVRTAKELPLLIATRAESLGTPAARRLESAGAELLGLPADADGRVDLAKLLDEFGTRQWTYLLVEGGEAVLRSFLSAGLADELQVFIAPKNVGGAELPQLDIDEVVRAVSARLESQSDFAGDQMRRYLVKKG